MSSKSVLTKVFVLGLVGAITLGVAGCSKNDDSSSTTSSSVDSSSSQAEELTSEEQAEFEKQQLEDQIHALNGETADVSTDESKVPDDAEVVVTNDTFTLQEFSDEDIKKYEDKISSAYDCFKKDLQTALSKEDTDSLRKCKETIDDGYNAANILLQATNPTLDIADVKYKTGLFLTLGVDIGSILDTQSSDMIEYLQDTEQYEANVHDVYDNLDVTDIYSDPLPEVQKTEVDEEAESASKVDEMKTDTESATVGGETKPAAKK